MSKVLPEAGDFLPWNDPAYIANPFPWYEDARKNHPIYKSSDDTYIITRYEDIVKYGKLPSLSIVDPEWVPPGPWKVLSKTVLFMDPPKHTEVRRRTNKWFTPKLVNKWVEASEDFVNDRLNEIHSGEIFDANMLLGVGPTHAAMCSALQVTPNNFAPVIFSMHKTMAALAANASERVNQDAAEAFEYMGNRVSEIIAYKRANPGDGMVDALIKAQSDGEISEDELFQSLVLFWGSGGHNPSYIVSSGIEYFARHPEVYEMYRNQPEQRTAIINELFRLYPPELSFARYATEPFEMLGVQINPGERIRFIIDSANRDAEVFPNPDVLDPSRPPQAAQNISFGMGAHQCAGQVISRAEVETIFKVLSERVASFKLEGTPLMDNSDRSRAYVSLPVSVQKLS